ncbi:hypothetical protein SteCoe_30702 [Stentor coeruleus]|uniref:PPM-type phosphatase domain-containing protein n=1 Tax=Stentor coeruleus TaxID=5963 RepID=A0A1R2B2Z9_9CILI|nr:hypothetical protein SteCoe_30702 [Stentor coeruleus]
MGNCCKNQDFERIHLEFSRVNQEVEIEIRKKDGATKKPEKVRFTFKPAQTRVHKTISQAGIQLKISGIVLPGQDPHNKIAKECQDGLLIFTEDQHIFLCIFDGHGTTGKATVDFCISYMNAFISGASKNHIDDPCRFLTEMIISCDKQLRENTDIDTAISGTTAVCCYLRDEELYVASVGDSRAILASIGENREKEDIAKPNPYKKNIHVENEIKYTLLTIDQKPDVESEKERILESGAKIRQLTNLLGQPIGPARVWNKAGNMPGLAMSRSIGDNVAKKLGVISNPIVQSFSITPRSDLFLVLASDGVWDVLTNTEAIRYVDYYRKHCDNSSIPVNLIDPKNSSIAELLAEYSRYCWLSIVEDEDVIIDDISVIILELNSLFPDDYQPKKRPSKSTSIESQELQERLIGAK